MSAVDPKLNGHNGTPYEWTVLLYMAGDNNLSEECVYALIEIKKALRNHPRLKVVAQFDPAGQRAATRRYELGSLETSLDEEVIWNARETDTGEAYNLLEFLRSGILQYRAEKYMVVLVGHGTGTDDDFLRDENPGNSLSIPDLRFVFEQLKEDGHTIAILGMDTCLMSMAEVCYELSRLNVTYLVGSEGFTPNTGWPYASILTELADKIPTDGTSSEADARWLAQMIVDKYLKFYEPYIHGAISIDQAVLDVAEIEGVKSTLSSLVEALLEEFNGGKLDRLKDKQNALLLAHWEAQSYNGEVFVDLYDFCQLLEERYKDAKVVERCQKVKAAILKLVVRNVVSGAAFQYSYGLSIYFPWAAVSRKYSNLSFPQTTRWIDFLDLCHQKTRRIGRGQVTPARVNGGPPMLAPFNLPVRASVPTNKGRDGEVQSMRNPPTEEYVYAWPPEDPPPGKRSAQTRKRTAYSSSGNNVGKRGAKARKR